MKLGGDYLVKYEGLNFNKFIDICIKHNINLQDVKIVSAKEIYFKVSASDYKQKLLKMPNKWYNVSIVKRFGLTKIKHTLIKRIGLVVGMFCVIISCILFSKTTFNYNITGCETILKDEVVNAIESFGISKGKINNFSNEELEKHLISQIPNISLVSVMTRGNTLCVNIKEKTLSEVQTFDYITAPYTMLINKVNLTSGTLLVKEGDVVLKGTQLVAPYTLGTNGSKVPCKAIAKISADVWFCGNVDFKTKDRVLVRTGKKVVLKELKFNNKTLLKNSNTIDFEYYENEYTEKTVKNFFFPLSFIKNIYYECEYVDMEYSLEENQQRLLNESKQNALNSLPSGFKVTEETQKVIKVAENSYKIQTYLKTSLEINNEG